MRIRPGFGPSWRSEGDESCLGGNQILTLSICGHNLRRSDSQQHGKRNYYRDGMRGMDCGNLYKPGKFDASRDGRSAGRRTVDHND